MKKQTNSAASTVRFKGSRSFVKLDPRTSQMILKAAEFRKISPDAWLEQALAAELPKLAQEQMEKRLNDLVHMRNSSEAPVKLAKAIAEFIQEEGAITVPMKINVRLFPSELIGLAHRSKLTGKSIEDIVGEFASGEAGEYLSKQED